MADGIHKTQHRPRREDRITRRIRHNESGDRYPIARSRGAQRTERRRQPPPHGQFQNCGRDFGAESRGKGRLASRTTSTKTRAVFRRNAKIDPQVQKGGNESRTEQSPPHGEECPEDAGIVELPHPQPFLYPARDERQDSDDRDRSNNHQSYGAPGRLPLGGRTLGSTSRMTLPLPLPFGFPSATGFNGSTCGGFSITVLPLHSACRSQH